MDELLGYLKQNVSDILNYIKIVNIEYNKTTNSLVVKVVYKPEFNFSNEIKEKLNNLVNNYLNIPNLIIEIKSKKSLIDNEAVKELIKYYFNKYYASILSTMQSSDVSVNIGENLVYVNISLLNAFKEHLISRRADVDLKNFLERNYFNDFSVSFSEKTDNNELLEVLEEHNKVFEDYVASTYHEVIHNYEITDIVDFVGLKVGSVATSSTSLKTSDVNITVSGEVNFFTKKTYISKRKDTQGQEKEYYNFVLNDAYGKTHCVYFPTKDAIEKINELKDGDYVAVIGDVEEFNGKVNFKVKGISYCSKPITTETPVDIKTENKNYKYIKPEPYLYLSQATLFDVAVENTNQFLKDNVCVVFDVETTGLEATTCEIIEIGAAKVVDGKITETFSCLVKPKNPIPEEITEITGITNDMVKDCYTINEILQDFYKFTRNSVLVAYNIAFDYKFLYVAGNAQGYVFDNKQIDALVVAKTKLKGLKNYKLKTVATKLNIPLDNAHRAVYDAIATAEVFIKLIDSDTKL